MAEVQIKSLTRGQIKEMRKAGYDLARLEKRNEEKAIEAMEWIFDNAYPELANDDNIPYSEVIRIAKETYQKTYGVEKEIKN